MGRLEHLRIFDPKRRGQEEEEEEEEGTGKDRRLGE
jgi:hypothetical protein